MTIKLNNAAIEQLKKSQWQEVEKDRKITGDFSTDLLREITGLNADILNTKIENAYYEATYTKTENGENEYAYNLCIGYLTENHDTIFICHTEDNYDDFLELFTEKEPEKTEEELKWEQFNDSLAGFIGENDYNEVIEQIKQNHTPFWNKIVEDVLDNAEEDEIPENLKEDIGKTWAENNTDDLKETYLSNASSYDLKDLATEIINDYL